MDVVIPIAAEVPAFAEAGHDCPKLLIDVNGTPMIEWATASLDGLADESAYVVPVLQSHVREYAIDDRLKEIYSDDITVVSINGMTDGAAETVLKAHDHIGEYELVVAFGDQYAEAPLVEAIQPTDADGVIPVFESSSPTWSYVTTDDESGVVTGAIESADSSFCFLLHFNDAHYQNEPPNPHHGSFTGRSSLGLLYN
jgi:NDP-sugar pyrophosphorylase family protein